MKTSNKILLGAFFTALLILISLHVALYAKYKKGDFTLVSNDWQPNLATISLDNVKYVTVDNVENVSVHLSDTAKVQYDKPGANDENILSFTKKDDTLFVVGKSNRGNEGRWYRRADIYLSPGLPLKAVNTNMHFDGRGKNFNHESLSFFLDHSFFEMKDFGSATDTLNDLTISAFNRSSISLNNVRVNHLRLNLNEASVEEDKLIADSIYVTTDPESSLRFSAQNLIKTKLTNHE